MTRRSVSQLTSFAQCAESYRLSRIAKVPSKPAGWFGHGHAAHHAIEHYELLGRTWSPSDITDVFYEAYDEEIAKLKEQWPEEHDWMTGGRKRGWNDIADRREIGAWQVRDYIRYATETAHLWRVMPLPNNAPAVEVEFTLDLNGVSVYGFIDQIIQMADGTLRANDIKSGTSTPSSPVQLATYSLVVEEQTGFRPTHGAFLKLGRPATAKTPEKPTVEVLHDLSRWTRELLTQEFTTMDKIEAAGLYLANAVDGCERTCGVADYCRIKGSPELAARFATITARPEQQDKVALVSPVTVVDTAPTTTLAAYRGAATAAPITHPDPWDPAAPGWEEGNAPF